MRRGILAMIAILGFGCDSSKPAADGPKIDLSRPGNAASTDDFETANPAWEFAIGHWERRASGSGWVLAQTGPGQSYNVALLKDRRFGDVDVRVRFRPVSGQVDASGGIVFRAQDAKNYFVVRANALEGNFRLYKTIDGDRRQISSASVTAPALGSWHSMRVVVQGDHIQGYLDDKLLLDEHDTTFGEGWNGLWTKEDSVTEFDDLQASGSPGQGRK